MGVKTRTRSLFCKACAVAVIFRKSNRVMRPSEFRLEGWNVRCMDLAGDIDGGKRKNHRNPIVRTTDRIVVTTLLVFRFAFMLE